MDNFNIKEAEKLRQKLDKQIQEYYDKQELDYRHLSVNATKVKNKKNTTKFFRIMRETIII